jgi:hypothetical protein
MAPDAAEITVRPLVAFPASVPRATPVIGFSSPGRIVVPESSRYITIPVRASGLRAPVTVSVTTRSGAASVNEDFVPPVPTLTLTPARPEGRVLVSILGDDVAENVEDFSVRLAVADGTATLGERQVTVVLTDVDRSASSARRASP